MCSTKTSMNKSRYLASCFGFESRNSQVKIRLGKTIRKRALDIAKDLFFAFAVDQVIKRQRLLLVLVAAGHYRQRDLWVFVRNEVGFWFR